MAGDKDEESRDELAEDRTDLAEDRTLLAHERSFAGWMRTGMAAIGIGLGFNALFGTMEPDWAAKAIATAFLIAAAYIFLSAERRARAALGRIDRHRVSVLQPLRIRLLAWLLTLLSLALAAALWLLIGPAPPDPAPADRASGAPPARAARDSPPRSGADLPR